MSPDLSVVKNSDNFFYDLLSAAVNNQKINISDQVKIYLIKLLSENVIKNDLISKSDTPLSIIFHKSMIEPIKERKMMLKYVGDYSLYVAGYFSESLNRKIIDTGYYISIGGQAFGRLSNLSSSPEVSTMYGEMFGKFNMLVDVLMEISFETSMTRAQDIIRMYDRWVHTGSPVLERKLIEKGVITSDKKLKIA